MSTELKGLVRKTIASKGENLITEMIELQISDVMSEFKQMYRNAKKRQNTLKKQISNVLLNFNNVDQTEINNVNKWDMEIKAIDEES